MQYMFYDFFWLIDIIITLVIKYYVLIAIYRFVKNRRWPKFNW